MKKKLLQYLCCPGCTNPLNFFPLESRNEEIVDGFFLCGPCNTSWVVFGGIPRFISAHLLENNPGFISFMNKFEKGLKENRVSLYGVSRWDTPLENLKEKTCQSFGFEWEYFNQWGWIRDEDVTEEEKKYQFWGALISQTQLAFQTKCLLGKDELDGGNLILDAGCGNGRFSGEAAKGGGEVIGVDIGEGVQTAYSHLKDLKNVHIIQGDLFRLPFKKEIFDSVFSIAVLMHTGHAPKAFESISQHIKKNGKVCVHLYHKRNWIFESIDGLIRLFTTRLSIPHNLKFAQYMAGWGEKLMRNGRWSSIFKYIEVLPTVHHMFDWYSAPIASHHTYPEVKKWFQRMGFEVLNTMESGRITFMSKPESLTLKGSKR